MSDVTGDFSERLIEFLRARLDEDDAFCSGPICCCEENSSHDTDCPERVLREVEVKRRIIARHNPTTGPSGHRSARRTHLTGQTTPL